MVSEYLLARLSRNGFAALDLVLKCLSTWNRICPGLESRGVLLHVAVIIVPLLSHIRRGMPGKWTGRRQQAVPISILPMLQKDLSPSGSPNRLTDLYNVGKL